MANFAENADSIRESVLADGFSSLKSRIRNVQVDLQTEGNCNKKKAVKKYTKEEIAERAVVSYKTNVKQQPDSEKKEKEEAGE